MSRQLDWRIVVAGVAAGVFLGHFKQSFPQFSFHQLIESIAAQLFSRAPAAQPPAPAGLQLAGRPHPRGYVAYRAPADLPLNGKLDHPAWQAAPWSEEFQDIMGPEHSPQPWHSTRMKMLWDEEHLYIGAQLEDPHPFAIETMHDSIIFQSNDFEVFIDPDGDNWMYYEIEVNAHGTLWDLLLVRPYRNGGPPLHSWESIAPSEPTLQSGPTGWAPLQRVVHVDGELNDGSVESKGWSVEMAIPWNLLAHAANRASPPKPGDQWRINFSRVHWRVKWDEAEQMYYKDPPDQAESNWVWAAQYAVAMHQPETWGYVQFADAPVEAAAAQPVAFAPDATWPLRGFLMDLYNAQHAHWQAHGSFSSSLARLGVQQPKAAARAGIETTQLTFIAWADLAAGQRVLVNEQGRITALPQGSTYNPQDGNSQWGT